MTTLEEYDDRRISLYDNLNIVPATTTTTTTNIIVEPKELDVTSAPSHVDYNNRRQKQSSIFNGNEQQQQQEAELKPVQAQQLSYCDIRAFGAKTPITNTLLASSKVAVNTRTTITPIKDTTTTTTMSNMQANSTTINNKSSNSNCNIINNTPTYVSQHSPTEAYETSQNNIAAVKAALHDAKSKFFGVNDYSQQPENDYNKQFPINRQQSIHKTANKKQPTYQNIPENSAIYRQNVTFNENSNTSTTQIDTPGQEQSTTAREIEIIPIYKTTSPHNNENNLSMSQSSPNEQPTGSIYSQIPINSSLEHNEQPSQVQSTELNCTF